MFRQNRAETMPDSSSEAPVRLIDTVSYNGQAFVFESQSEVERGDDDPVKVAIRDTIVDLYPPEKFHRTFCGVLGWSGRRLELHSLAVEHDDEALQAATEVIHRRLVSRVGHRVLARLDSEDARDLLKLSLGFGPLVASVAKEMAQKRKASLVEDEGEDDGS